MKIKDTQKSLEIEILNCKKKLKELAPHIEIDEEKSKESATSRSTKSTKRMTKGNSLYT